MAGWTGGSAWWGCATSEVAEVAEIEENPPETAGPGHGGDLAISVTKSADSGNQIDSDFEPSGLEERTIQLIKAGAVGAVGQGGHLFFLNPHLF
ncbi:unnamed protein product [Cuscuta campestris]|uniref:Uncharacterized protein n=1 Tax=Cuscuta campestris TaxID=132261 RepID=A0A484LFX3_9ASTE|nr:unnamed protein product [Cuscuta campestris]